MEKTCPICGKQMKREGFCDDCYRKVEKRFPNDEWEVMDFDEIKAAIENIDAVDVASAVSEEKKSEEKSTAPKKKSAEISQSSGSEGKKGKTTKPKKASPIKRIIQGVAIIVIAALLFPWLLGDYFDYRFAKDKKEIQAILSEYTWKYDSHEEQYEIQAKYTYDLGNGERTYSDTQYNARPGWSRLKTGSLKHQGKENDPAEVKPHSSITLRAYQKGDGEWKVLGSTSDIVYIVVGCFAIVCIGIGMIVSGIKKLTKK